MDLPAGWRRAGPFRANAGFRPALERAREEAANRNHRLIRPSHILAGVFHQPDARILAVLEDLGIGISGLATRLAQEMGAGIIAATGGPNLAYTPRGAAVTQGAVVAAERMQHDWLGAIHLLAAISEETWGAAPRVLREAGAEPEKLLPAIARTAQRLPPLTSPEPDIYSFLPSV